jgi:hypothetical protein
MSEKIRCEYCHKFSNIKDVIRFYPYSFIHIDQKHGCIFKHLRRIDAEKINGCLGELTDSQRFAMAKKL